MGAYPKMSVDGRPSIMTTTRQQTLATLVARATALAPDAVALVGLGSQVTWQAVERHTAALASRLLSSGVRPGDRVAVARLKGHESFEAVHAILRAGATVVPIDPLAPPSIGRAVLADAGVRAVIGDARTVRALDPWSAVAHPLAAVVVTDQLPGCAVLDWQTVVGDESREDLPAVDPGDIAYIIYTSGSTGRPKGIVHTHRSAMAYAERAVAEYGLSTTDRLAGMSPLHVDMSTLELYAAPLACATVVIMSEFHLQFPASLTSRSAECGVTVWYTVPFVLRGVVEHGALDRRALPTLRAVLYGGEPYAGASLRQLMRLLPQVSVVNVYGPAEVNACTHHHITDPSVVGDHVPIGKPWDGADVRVVDERGEAVPPGMSGELWVSTPTVMDRYWGLDDLTRQRLRSRADRPSWYATGDIVVQDVDGRLWFEGRRDHQVKVRGARLELEAIERVLTDAPDVVHAVAASAGSHGDASHIVAAVVLRDGATPDTPKLRRWCADRLQVVAVPQRILYLSTMPVMGSGKVDRATVRALLRDSMVESEVQS